MSSNLPHSPFGVSPEDNVVEYPSHFFLKPSPSKREWFASIVLFCVTVLSTSYAGLFYSIGEIDFFRLFRIFAHSPSLIIYGLPFSLPLISILLAHELGHFFACQYYGMRCTPPYFIPIPVSITGTLGAFIKIRSHFPNRRALFDIGVAGPIAGFVLAMPTLWIGISMSKLIPKGMLPPGGLSFGEPLIFRYLGSLLLGYMPDKQDMVAHPIAMAAWVGLLATSLNLLPIWQLDGGHIAYAVLGRTRQKKLSIYCLTALVLLSFGGWPTPSYLLFAALLLIIGIRVRFFHPPTMADDEELGTGRIMIGVCALVILIVSFIPIPISIS